MNPGRWLTARRLRAHGILLALTLWSIYAWVLATPGLCDRNGNLKGTDFLHFYVLGTLAIENRGEALYDMDAQAGLAARRVPAAEGIHYLPLYPPQVSLLFKPLAYLSYEKALDLWWLFSGLLYSLCCYCIWRFCPHLRGYGGTVFILAAAFPAFFHLIAWGQTSALALACFTVSLLCIREKKDFWAGVSLGLLIFKPQLALAAAILFVLLGAWCPVIGATLSAITELSVGLLYYGKQPLLTWLKTLWRVPQEMRALEPRPYQTHCLRTFWSMLIPTSSISFALYLLSAVAVVAVMLQVWKHSNSWALRSSGLLLASVLVAPHLTVYDLVILAPALLLLADWLLSHRNVLLAGNIGILLYLVYALPIVGFLSRWTHLQLSVLAMALLLSQMWKAARLLEGLQNSVLSTPAGLAKV